MQRERKRKFEFCAALMTPGLSKDIQEGTLTRGNVYRMESRSSSSNKAACSPVNITFHFILNVLYLYLCIMFCRINYA